MCEQDSERHLQACVSALTGHAGFRSGGEDEDDDGDGDCCCGSGTEEGSSMQTGLIQKAFVFPLPFLLVPLCWSVWNMSSLLLRCKRSLCSSLSTRWMIHSRLLSTFPHTFSCDKETLYKVQILGTKTCMKTFLNKMMHSFGDFCPQKLTLQKIHNFYNTVNVIHLNRVV